jgi:hypothetical protein
LIEDVKYYGGIGNYLRTITKENNLIDFFGKDGNEPYTIMGGDVYLSEDVVKYIIDGDVKTNVPLCSFDITLQEYGVVNMDLFINTKIRYNKWYQLVAFVSGKNDPVILYMGSTIEMMIRGSEHLNNRIINLIF